MADQIDIEWPPCDEDGCIGVRLATPPNTAKCLAHADDDQRNTTLKQFGETGEIDVRGVTITQALLQQILAAAPHDPDNRPTFRAARFDEATFQGDAVLSGVTFQGDAAFTWATFQGDAEFDAATFQGYARFNGTTFERDAQFVEATFLGWADFADATFQVAAVFIWASFLGQARFDRATFQGYAEFVQTFFQGDAVFTWATFERNAIFEEATFHGLAEFYGTTFEGDAQFAEATFQGYAQLTKATFEQARQFGPFLAYRGLQLDEVQFTQPVLIEASTIGLCCRRARFAGGVQLRLRWARVLLDDADLTAPSILARIPRLTSGTLAKREQRIAQAWQRFLASLLTECSRMTPDGAGRRLPERPPAPPDTPAELRVPDGVGRAGTVTVGVRNPRPCRRGFPGRSLQRLRHRDVRRARMAAAGADRPGWAASRLRRRAGGATGARYGNKRQDREHNSSPPTIISPHV